MSEREGSRANLHNEVALFASTQSFGKYEDAVRRHEAAFGRAAPAPTEPTGRGGAHQIKINGRRVLEHRWVMEQELGRPLRQDEHVHHKNRQRLDNRPENLEVVTTAEHAKRHTWRPITKACVVCGAEFTPHKTKRARAQTCGMECKRSLLSIRNAERKSGVA